VPSSPNPRYRLFAVSFDTDFLVFLVVFTAQRAMAELRWSTLTLAIAGAGLTVCFTVFGLLCGPLSDRVGRKRMLAAATSVQLSSVAACLFVWPEHGLYLFLPVYWALGASSGMLYPALIAWLNQGEDATANRRGVNLTIIRFCFAWNLGLMTGQLAAGHLFPFGREVPLLVALAFSWVNFALVMTADKDRIREKAEGGGAPASSTASHPLAPAYFRLCWLANVGGTFAGGIILFLLPELMVVLDVPSEQHGMVLALWRAAAMSLYLVMYRSAFWHYRFSTSLVSQALAVAGLLLIVWTDSIVVLALGLVLVGQLGGYNYFASLYYGTAGSSDERRGLAASLHEATLAIGMAAGTLGGGLVGAAANARAPYVLAAAVIVALAVAQCAAYLRWISPKQNQATVPGPAS